ncbi:MAG: methyltransferase domain-containing protein [Myxococcales bacterium]|nr:methyltransferase domain-containing protein [Myxococcales bacterium]
MPAPLNPAPLIELATAYWGSATLIAAIRLDLFTALAAGPQRPDELAERLGADPVATDALLSGLAALDLVTKDSQGRFANGGLAQAFLVAGQPGFLGPALQYNGDVFPLWANLHDVVRTGDVTRAPEQYLGDDAGRTRNFVYGMHHRALGVGRAVAQTIDLNGRTRMADIGGGPGTYASLIVQQTPGLSAEVLDLPAVVAIAREIVDSMGAAERVQCTPFDYYRDSLPGTYDAALISGVLHREQPPQVQAIFRKAAAAVAPGGVLYVSDVMLDDDRAGPLFGTMFALNMRVLAHDGRCHSVAEQSAWLADAGFEVTQVTRLPAPIHYTVIRAERR